MTAPAAGYALFRREAGLVHGHPDVGSPWTEGALSGAAVSALVAALAEEVPAPGPFLCTRMALELLRPVPKSDLRPEFEVVREGRRQQVLRLSLLNSAQRLCAVATFVRLRTLPAALPANGALDFTPPAGEPFVPTVQGRSSGFLRQLEGRLVPRTSFDHRSGWLRYQGQVLAGVPLSPFAHAALYADFGNGMASGVDPRQFNFQNAELTLHLARVPAGSWIHLDCRTIDGGVGLGTTHVAMADALGPFGFAHQSLLYEPRG